MLRKAFGMAGESYACKYLQNRKYRIIERNYTCKLGEIDIIAEKDGCIVFVEVKSRASSKFGEAALAVDYKKQQKIKSLILHYTAQKQLDCDLRFDVIEIYGKMGNNLMVTGINHIKNVMIG